MLLNRKAPETVAVLHRSADRTSTGDLRLGQTSDGSLNSSPIHPTRFRSLQFELRAAMTVLLPGRRPLTYPQEVTSKNAPGPLTPAVSRPFRSGTNGHLNRPRTLSGQNKSNRRREALRRVQEFRNFDPLGTEPSAAAPQQQRQTTQQQQPQTGRLGNHVGHRVQEQLRTVPNQVIKTSGF